jgi:Phage integrase family/Trypsin-like peptidase domain
LRRDHCFISQSLLAFVLCAPLLSASGSAQSTTNAPSAADIFKKASQAVVTVTTPTGFGSGVLVDAVGVIVTNLHVVRGVERATVRLSNGDAYDDVSVVEFDSRKDLVLLKIKGFKLPSAELGDSDQLAIGEKVYAIGAPKAASKHRLGAMFCVALAVGLRLGEALGLRWEDVDLQNGTLTVRQALQRVEGKLQFVEPKSEKSRRRVQLPEIAVDTLKRHRTRQKKDRLKAGGDWQDSTVVFTSSVGSPLDERNVRRAFKDVPTAAKLPKMRIHDLRHTCATLLLAQGVHPKVVQEILGHSQISLTMDTYSTVLPTVSRAPAEQMDAVLRA